MIMITVPAFINQSSIQNPALEILLNFEARDSADLYVGVYAGSDMLGGGGCGRWGRWGAAWIAPWPWRIAGAL